MISRLEHDERPPDVATIHALFVPALHLEKQPEVVAQSNWRITARNGEADDSLHKRQQLAGGAATCPAAPPVRLSASSGAMRTFAVAHLLVQKRLVTLTGPGGCGKTSLAVETCRWLRRPPALMIVRGRNRKRPGV